MIILRIINRLRRFYAEKSNNSVRINYYRRQGMKIGEKCIIGGRLLYTDEAYLIEIGDHVAIADDVLFITHDAGLWCFDEDYPGDDIFGKVMIGNNVNIGMRCTILLNTVIGNNCIVGAGSVVRGKFPDGSVILGNPAKVVANINVQRLIYSRSKGRMNTAKLSDKQKEPIVKKHFGI